MEAEKRAKIDAFITEKGSPQAETGIRTHQTTDWPSIHARYGPFRRMSPDFTRTDQHRLVADCPEIVRKKIDPPRGKPAPALGVAIKVRHRVLQWRPTTRGHEAAIGAATSCVLERAQPVPRDLDFAPEKGAQERESSENGRSAWARRVDMRRGNRC